MNICLCEQHLCTLLDEENALYADRGICVTDVVVRSEMLHEKWQNGEQLWLGELEKTSC